MADSLQHTTEALPVGTVTFLYTDIEGSTMRWEQHPALMKAAVERHDTIMAAAIEKHGGVIFRRMGDAFCAVFTDTLQAVTAALEAQHALHTESWDAELGELKVRMALHTGPGEVREGDYVGPHLNRIARLLSTGYGQQILVSTAVQALVSDVLPEGVGLLDLGEHRLKDLQRPEHIFQIVVPDLPSDFPQIKTLEVRFNNLPVQPTPFVGREKEVTAASAALRDPAVRLLTLTGPGGTGKTRLSLQTASNLANEFHDGVCFVGLSPIGDYRLVASTVAQTLGIPENGGTPVIDTLGSYLQDKQMLMVLDNFEQIIPAAPQMAKLLTASQQSKMLVTSREVLHIYGEQEFPVPPLGLADPKRLPPLKDLMQYEAIRLFVDRARSVKPDFELTEQNAQAVAEICYRLDGLPLAIELAAARIRLLPPQAMLSRLKSRLSLLTGGSRDLPARQQTLRGAIEWGHDLLEEQDKVLFRRLGVFVSGCTLESAEAVCSSADVEGAPEVDVLDGLTSLVEKSLLRQEEQEDGEPRFWMLETIREYARERLEESGELQALQRQHARYFLAMAEQSEEKVRGPEQKIWLQRLDAELDNFRAVHEWSLSEHGDIELGMDMTAYLSSFWQDRGGLSEGRRWSAALLSVDGERTVLRAKLMYTAAYGAFLQGDAGPARPLLEEAMGIFKGVLETEKSNQEARIGLAYTMAILGATLGFSGDPEKGRAMGEESIELFKAVGTDKWGQSLANLSSGTVIFLQGDIKGARSKFEQSMELIRQTGDRIMLGQTLNYRGDIARIEGDYAEAGARYEEALPIFKEQGSRSDVPAMLHNLGYVALAQGDFNHALELFEESMSLHQELANKQGILEAIAGFAALAGKRGQGERSARLFGVAEALRQANGITMWPAERVELERNETVARSLLPLEVWEQVRAEGAAMTFEQAVSYALEPVTSDE